MKNKGMEMGKILDHKFTSNSLKVETNSTTAVMVKEEFV